MYVGPNQRQVKGRTWTQITGQTDCACCGWVQPFAVIVKTAQILAITALLGETSKGGTQCPTMPHKPRKEPRKDMLSHSFPFKRSWGGWKCFLHSSVLPFHFTLHFVITNNVGHLTLLILAVMRLAWPLSDCLEGGIALRDRRCTTFRRRKVTYLKRSTLFIQPKKYKCLCLSDTHGTVESDGDHDRTQSNKKKSIPDKCEVIKAYSQSLMSLQITRNVKASIWTRYTG